MSLLCGFLQEAPPKCVGQHERKYEGDCLKSCQVGNEGRHHGSIGVDSFAILNQR